MLEEKLSVGYRVIVTGRVQGVGFRYFTAKQAKQLNIAGHAKNLKDGSVEVMMFAPQPALQQLLDWLKNGPELAIVESLKMEEIAYIKTEGFSCL